MDTVGGYRLVRKLGSGPRAEVYLGHAGSMTDASAARTAAIKLYRDGVDRASMDSEIDALARTSSPHLMELRDIATAPDGRPGLVLPRLAPASLARVLADRGRIEAGEAVTVLAPVAAAMHELHRAGVVHGGVHPGSVLFDGSGAPVLACFGHAAVVASSGHPPTQAELSEEPRVIEDLIRLGALASTVLGCVREVGSTPSGQRLLAWLEGVDPGAIAHRFTAELSDRLFDLATALPIEFEQAHTQPAPIPVRRSEQLVIADRGTPARNRSRRGAPGRWAEIVAGRLDNPHPLSEVAGKAKGALGRIRKPFWIVGGIGLAAVVAAFVLLPSTGMTGETDAATTPGAAVTRQSATAQPSRHAPVANASAANASAANAKARAAISGDDPAAAASALLAERDRCLDELSVLCLDGVDQEGSAALDSDRFLIRSLQEGGVASRGTSLASAKVTLAQRLGDSALMSLEPSSAAGSGETPTSILLVKGESGWRIRDVLSD